MAIVKKIGEILVDNGIISKTTLQRALEKSKEEHKKIGVTLESMGVVTDEEIAEALANQFNYKRVRNIASYSFTPELLQVISVDTAMQHLLFPLKKDVGKLCLAMADPTDTKIISNIAQNNNVRVIPYVATRADIIEAINKHYIKVEKASDLRKVVLIVEDNHLTSSDMKNLLSKEGYRIISAFDGIDAFRKAISESPDVILTDKEMPKLDGYKLLDAIKSLPETRRIPVLLVTASTKADEEEEALQRGFYDFMAKPVKGTTIIARIKRAIRSIEGVH